MVVFGKALELVFLTRGKFDADPDTTRQSGKGLCPPLAPVIPHTGIPAVRKESLANPGQQSLKTQRLSQTCRLTMLSQGFCKPWGSHPVDCGGVICRFNVASIFHLLF